MHETSANADIAAGASVDAAEIQKFSAMAAAWWDPHGDFKPLHRLNPVRIQFIRDNAAAHFGLKPHSDNPLSGLRLLDIGCGGGLLSEPMCRLGADVTAIDAAERNVQIAKAHAADMQLNIDYRHATAESLRENGDMFDIVLNMEVVEHVANVDEFLNTAAHLVRPGGLMIGSTLNRTVKAYAMAIVGAEYVLRWLPRGTHDWQKFVKPSELAGALRRAGLQVETLTGLVYNPINEKWRLSDRDLDVNYMAVASRPA